jgi:hypothetical protein
MVLKLILLPFVRLLIGLLATFYFSWRFDLGNIRCVFETSSVIFGAFGDFSLKSSLFCSILFEFSLILS